MMPLAFPPELRCLSFREPSLSEAWRNLNPYQRSQLASKEKAILEREAKERMSEGGRKGKPGAKGSQNSDTLTQRTDEQLAQKAGVSRDTIRKVEKFATYFCSSMADASLCARYPFSPNQASAKHSVMRLTPSSLVISSQSG